ncbi:hypothetical protein [Candidatus Tisiphia endosymbiont of Beris chalybata]|uniref:hypothetical protein n=1 Tax=Candidatus Tisiphia endosymbiont of Beris chalybata TaxID=3066262 RepID=UPI00312C9EB9
MNSGTTISRPPPPPARTTPPPPPPRAPAYTPPSSPGSDRSNLLQEIRTRGQLKQVQGGNGDVAKAPLKSPTPPDSIAAILAREIGKRNAPRKLEQ